METTNITYYLFCIIAIVVAFFVIKRVASCLIRTIITIAILAAMIYIYLAYFK